MFVYHFVFFPSDFGSEVSVYLLNCLLYEMHKMKLFPCWFKSIPYTILYSSDHRL